MLMPPKFLLVWAIQFSLLLTWIDTFIRKAKSKIRKSWGRLASPEEMEAFVKSLGIQQPVNPISLNSQLNKQFSWRADKKFFLIPLDYAKCPEAFLHDKQDDCDGFAMFYEFVCEKLGYEDVCRVYTKADNGRGHVVCVVRWEGHSYCLGNWEAFVFGSSELEDIGKTVAMGMKGKLDWAAKFKHNTFIQSV